MTWPVLITSIMLFGLLHAPYQPVTTKTYGLGDWRLTVQTDSFTHQATCRIANRNGVHPDVTVERSALAFHFDPHLDTSNAWYSVDGGPPHAWRDLQAQLVETGAMAQAERLDNETGGVVLIPLTDVRGAASVNVQATRHAEPRTIKLSALWRMVSSARGLRR